MDDGTICMSLMGRTRSGKCQVGAVWQADHTVCVGWSVILVKIAALGERIESSLIEWESILSARTRSEEQNANINVVIWELIHLVKNMDIIV
jgi:hypothetical protein